MKDLYPPFAGKVLDLKEKVKEQCGLVVGVHMGLRTWKRQEELYALGRTQKNPDGYDETKKPLGNIITNAKPGESWHNYGTAVDLVFKVGPKLRWSWEGSLPWLIMGGLGEGLGLTWGGRWKTVDLPHFQWKTNLKTTEALALYKQGGLEGVWEKLGGG